MVLKRGIVKLRVVSAALDAVDGGDRDGVDLPLARRVEGGIVMLNVVEPFGLRSKCCECNSPIVTVCDCAEVSGNSGRSWGLCRRDSLFAAVVSTWFVLS
jgi:hypothetical protein